jgi:hypothetical protein
MNSSLFKLDGKILGAEELKAIYEQGPKIVDTYFMKFFRFAGNQTSGSKKKDGVLRTALRGFRKTSNGQPYENKFVNMLNYRIDRNKMEMRSGLLYTTAKVPHQIMEGLESGVSRTKSSGYFIVPNYENVKSKIPMNMFHQMINAKQLTFAFKNNNVLYFDKKTSKVMFVGIKTIKINKKFDFNSIVDGVTPKLLKKSESVLQDAVNDIGVHKKFTDHDIGE